VKRDWRDVGVVISLNSSRAEDVLSSVPWDIRDRSEEIRRPNISGEFQQEGMKIAGWQGSLFLLIYENVTPGLYRHNCILPFYCATCNIFILGGQKGFFSTLCGCSSRPLNQYNYLANCSFICTISQSYIELSVCAGLFSSTGLFLLAGRYVHLTLMASLAIIQRIFQTTCFLKDRCASWELQHN